MVRAMGQMEIWGPRFILFAVENWDNRVDIYKCSIPSGDS